MKKRSVYRVGFYNLAYANRSEVQRIVVAESDANSGTLQGIVEQVTGLKVEVSSSVVLFPDVLEVEQDAALVEETAPFRASKVFVAYRDDSKPHAVYASEELFRKAGETSRFEELELIQTASDLQEAQINAAASAPTPEVTHVE